MNSATAESRTALVQYKSFFYNNRVILFDILYENDEIFLIHKKAGVAVQGGQGITHSVDEDFSHQAGFKIFLVHRLDKETEGLLVVAKNPAAASKWTKLFSTKEIKKEYIALCFGEPILNGKKASKGTINFPIEKNGRKMDAVSHFEVVSVKKEHFEIEDDSASENNSGGKNDLSGKNNLSAKNDLSGGNGIDFTVSKIRVKIDTGRMHQIRIHLAKVLCPIIGDDKHGNFKLNKKAKKYLKIKSLCLECVKLTLPIGGKPVTFQIPELF